MQIHSRHLSERSKVPPESKGPHHLTHTRTSTRFSQETAGSAEQDTQGWLALEPRWPSPVNVGPRESPTRQHVIDDTLHAGRSQRTEIARRTFASGAGVQGAWAERCEDWHRESLLLGTRRGRGCSTEASVLGKAGSDRARPHPSRSLPKRDKHCMCTLTRPNTGNQHIRNRTAVSGIPTHLGRARGAGQAFRPRPMQTAVVKRSPKTKL